MMEAEIILDKLKQIGEVEDATQLIDESYRSKVDRSFYIYFPEFNDTVDACVNVRIERKGKVIVDTSDMPLILFTDKEVYEYQQIVDQTDLDYDITRLNDRASTSLKMECKNYEALLLALTEIRWVTLKRMQKFGESVDGVTKR